MQQVRELLTGLKTAVRQGGLPNRWDTREISKHCRLPAETIEQVISKRRGILIGHMPCSLAICYQDGCAWVDVKPIPLDEIGAHAI